MTPGHPGVRVRNVREKSGPKSLCLCCFFFPESWLLHAAAGGKQAQERGLGDEAPIYLPQGSMKLDDRHRRREENTCIYNNRDAEYEYHCSESISTGVWCVPGFGADFDMDASFLMQFPNAIAVNAVGRRNTQMRAKERRCKT